jgi:VWFA-related protein
MGGTEMKNMPALFLAIFFGGFIFSQQHEVVVRNIEVPLRVYDGNEFVENLTIEDLELFEDGKPQTIQALYLTKNALIERKQAERDYMPFLPRSFYFVFQLLDYDPNIKEALDYFFGNIYVPGDYVSIMTVFKRYSLSPEALKSNSRETVVDYIQNVIRKDTQIVAREYNQLLKEVKSIARGAFRFRDPWAGDEADLAVPQELIKTRYEENMQRMDDLRMVDEKKFLRFASQIKRMSGQHFVFFFYQREFRPYIDGFDYIRPRSNLNVEKVSRVFADSSVMFNFIFIGRNPPQISGIRMRELPGNIKEVFADIASATGGISNDTPNSTTAFQNVSESISKSYILYYSPNKYTTDGKFRKIEVRIKGKKYKILHRKGYFAN